MKSKFRKGQRVICTHYKDRPVVTVTDILIDDDGYVNVWVKEKGCDTGVWWGPASWFKAIPKKKAIRPIHKPKAPKPFVVNGLANEGSLCDAGIPGCSCNQSTSMAQ